MTTTEYDYYVTFDQGRPGGLFRAGYRRHRDGSRDLFTTEFYSHENQWVGTGEVFIKLFVDRDADPVTTAFAREWMQRLRQMKATVIGAEPDEDRLLSVRAEDKPRTSNM